MSGRLMSIIFISDLHLQEDDAQLLALFEQFVRTHALKAQSVYILGDLFEAWIGDDDLTAFNRHIARLLATLVTQGIHVYFMPGNRDFLLKENFCRLTGMTLLPDPTLIEAYNLKILLTHGDTLCTDDLAYQKYRRKIQNPWTVRILYALPLRIRQYLAKNLRGKSNEKLGTLANKEPYKFDVNAKALHQLFDQYAADMIIHGHTHKPSIHLLKQNDTWQQHQVLSDWHESGHYLLLDAQGAKHHYFSGTPE